ncbi:MAG: DNA-binding protein [Simplicispira suum]|nr:DNA-binding protein [Simplicispira suum]
MREAHAPQQFNAPFPPLALVNKPNLTTAETAYYLNRRPQTLRGWACLENGPLRPTRIGGLLAWNTATVKALAGVTA